MPFPLREKSPPHHLPADACKGVFSLPSRLWKGHMGESPFCISTVPEGRSCLSGLFDAVFRGSFEGLLDLGTR